MARAHIGEKATDIETDIKLKNFIAAVAKQYPDLVTTYLFGSYAKGMQRDESDIDVAFVFDDFNDCDEFDIQVELIVIRKSPCLSLFSQACTLSCCGKRKTIGLASRMLKKPISF